jgi:hypothetical protein
MAKKPEKKIKKIWNKTERQIERIMVRERRSWHYFLRQMSDNQIRFVKKEIKKVVEVYPPFMQKFIMTWLIVGYCSIIPGAGTASLILWGGIAKMIIWIKK